MAKTQEQVKRDFYTFIDKIIFVYCKEWMATEEEREYLFKRTLKVIKGTNEPDKFREELDNAVSLETYKEEFEAVKKLLLKWKGRS